jgi:hypothetical protein
VKKWQLVQPSVGQNGYFELNNNTLLTGTDMESIVIAPGVMTKGVTYTFRLVVSDGNGNIFNMADSTFTCAVPPSAGTITLSPSTGTALVTNFVATTANWGSSTGALKYRFSYVDSTGAEVSLTDYSSSGSSSVVLPEGSPLTLVCYASDAYGVESRTTTSVTVAPLTIDKTSDTSWRSLINGAFADPATGTISASTDVAATVQKTNAILSVLNGDRAPKCNVPCVNGSPDVASGTCICPTGWNGVDCSVNSTLYATKQSAREQLLTAFLVSASVISAAPASDSVASMYISTLARSATVFDEMDNTLYLLLLNSLSKVLTNVKILSAQASDDTANLINAVINKNYLKSSGGIDLTAINYIRDTLLPLYVAKVANNLVVGERSSGVHKDSVGFTVQKQVSGSKSQLVSDGFECPKAFATAGLSLETINVNTGARRQASSDDNVAVSFIHYNYDPHRASLSTPSTLVSTVVGTLVTDSNGVALKASVPAGKYVQVVVPGNYQTNSSYDCQMWNETAASWDTKGCFSQNITETQVTCYCNAFGDFSVRPATRTAVVEPVAAAGGIGLWWLFFLVPLVACCCCCFIFIIIVIIIVVIKKRRDKKKEEEKMNKLDAANIFTTEEI